MAKAKLSNNDFKVNRLKTVKNPSLSFFGPTGDYARSTYWQSHAYDLYEYSRIIDTEAFATRAFNKKTTLMFKAGYSLSSENEKNANQAIVWDKWNNPIGYDLPADKNFHGITPGRNTIYEILQF